MPQLYQPPKTKRPKIVAAIPSFNTEAFIADVVSKANKHVDQVIVVDDGSYDSTAKVARVAGALVISHAVNEGYGVAIMSCFKEAKANAAGILVILDGDGQHNPEEIPLLLGPILEGEADLIIGSRFLTDEVNIPRHRKLGISIITFLLNFGSRTKVSDAQSGFRAYSQKVVDALSPSEKSMGVSIEILVQARRRSFIIKEVPVSCHYTLPKINMKAIRQGLSIALATVKLRLRYSILK